MVVPVSACAVPRLELIFHDRTSLEAIVLITT